MAQAFGRKEISQGSTVSRTGLHREGYWDKGHGVHSVWSYLGFFFSDGRYEAPKGLRRSIFHDALSLLYKRTQNSAVSIVRRNITA